MARPPWEKDPVIAGEADAFQPPQQAMGRDAQGTGLAPLQTGQEQQTMPPADAAPWEQDITADSGGEIVSEEDGPAPQSRMSPEDEAAILDFIRRGDASGARQFAASKGFDFTNAEQVLEAFQKNGKINTDAIYKLAPMDTGEGGAGAFLRGLADIPTAGLLDEAGALVDTLGGTEGRGNVWNSDQSFAELYKHNLDLNRGILQGDEAEHPTARIVGQLLGGMAIPAGLEGVGLKAGTAALRSGATMQEARAIAATAVRNRMMQAGGATGAAHGFGAGDGDLGERLLNSGSEALLGAAGGLVLGKAGETLQPTLAARAASARATPMTGGQRVAAAAQRLGITDEAGRPAVLPADVGGPATRRMTAAAAQAPLSASPIINAAQRVIEMGKGVRDRVAAAAGTAADAEEAGQKAAEGARAYIRSSRSRIQRIYDTAGAMAGDIRLPLNNARAELDDQIARLSEVPGAKEGIGNAGKELKEAQALRQALEGNFTVQGVRDMRTEMFVSPDFRGTPLERRLGRVIDAAALDIEQGLVSAGKSDAARAFATADKQWRERLKTIQRVIEPIIGKSEDKAKSGEEIIAALERASKGNAARLRGFLDALPPDEAGMVRATLINHLGRASSGAQNAEGDAFSLSKFLTDWDKLGEGAKRALFGAEGRAALNDLATVANGTKEAQRYANFSNTSGGIWGNLGLLASGAVYAPKAAAAGAAAQLISGRLLSSPRFTRWLARAPRSSLSAPAYIDRLSRIARAEPAIANEVLALQQRLAEAFTSSPTRLAADEGDNESSGIEAR